MSKKIDRPQIVEDKHLIFLDKLRESGVTNMFGAGSYIPKIPYVDKEDARIILKYWMDSFGERDE